MENTDKKKKHIIYDIPFIGPVVGAGLAFVFITGIFGTIGTIFSSSIEGFDNIMMIVGSALALIIHKSWFKPEFEGCINRNTGDKKTVTLIIIAFVVGIFTNVASLIVTGAHAPTIQTLIMALTAGMFEETVFRGIPVSIAMRNVKSKGGIIIVAVLTSVLFGLMHIFNLFSGADYAGTILQIFSSMCGGLLFGAIYLTTGNLLIPIAMHTFHDTLSFMANNISAEGIVLSISSIDYITTIVHAIANLICGILLLTGDYNLFLSTWDKIWNREQQKKCKYLKADRF